MEMVSETMNTFRAAFLNNTAFPSPDEYPPGIVNAAANVMVAMSIATSEELFAYF